MQQPSRHHGSLLHHRAPARASPSSLQRSTIVNHREPETTHQYQHQRECELSPATAKQQFEPAPFHQIEPPHLRATVENVLALRATASSCKKREPDRSSNVSTFAPPSSSQICTTSCHHHRELITHQQTHRNSTTSNAATQIYTVRTKTAPSFPNCTKQQVHAQPSRKKKSAPPSSIAGHCNTTAPPRRSSRAVTHSQGREKSVRVKP